MINEVIYMKTTRVHQYCDLGLAIPQSNHKTYIAIGTELKDAQTLYRY